MSAVYERVAVAKSQERSLGAESPALEAPRTTAHGQARRVVLALVALAAAAMMSARPAAAALFGPCDPYAAVAGGSPVSVPSSVGERGVDDAICALEGRVLADIAGQRGMSLDALAATEILAHGRNEVRAQLLVKLIQAANTPPSSRDSVQQGAVDWLLERVKDVRITQATRALDEFRRWQSDRCGYVPPPGFTYTPGPGQCGGSLTALFSGGPLPPSYEELVRYGIALTFAELGGGAVGNNLANLSRDITAYLGGVAISTGVVAAAVAGLAVVNTSTAIAGLIFATEGAVATGTVGFVAPGTLGFGSAVAGPAAIVLAGVVVSVVRGVQVFEAADIEPELEGDISRAQLTDEATLIALLSSQEGMSLAMLAFAGETAGDSPVPASLALPTNPPLGTPVLRTVVDGFAVATGPTFTYANADASVDRVWLDRNWWVVDRGADGGPTEIHPVLVVLGPTGSARSVRFTGDGFVVSAFDPTGTFSCPGAGCTATPNFEYLTLANGTAIVGRSSFAGLPPLIDSGPTVTGDTLEGGAVTLTLVAHDPAGGPVTVAWTVESDDGAGGTATWSRAGTAVDYEIARPGNHTVTAKLTNSLGLATSVETSFFATATLSSQLTLTPQNPPTECSVLGNVVAQVDPALLAIANPIVVRLDVDDDGTYDVFATTDASGRAVLPIFRAFTKGPHLFRAQTVGFETGHVMEETREFIVVGNAHPGPVEVELRYPDGTWGSPPVIDPNAEDLGLPHFEEGEEIAVRARVFDPCDEPVDIYVGWGLAVPSLQQIDVIEQAEPGEWYALSHVFSGDFFPAFVPAVVVAGVDSDGAVSPEFGGAFFIVDNVAPSIDALEITAQPGHRVRLTAKVGDAAGIGEIQEITVDWGDGSESGVEIDSAEAIGHQVATIVASHEYATAGPRTVTLRVRDNQTTTTASVLVNVFGLAPVISVLELDAGYDSRMVIVVDDPDGDGTAAAVAIDWGDGSAPVAAPFDASAGGFVGTHSYASAGTFRVVLAAVDESGIAAPDLIGSLTVLPDPIVSFQFDVDRAMLSTWRGGRPDNGFLMLRGLLSDPSPDGTLLDRILAGGFEIVVRDGDASFDVTVPLANCRRRGARGILCRQTSPRRIHALLIPENRRDPLSPRFTLRLSARKLHESETGPTVRGVSTLEGAVAVSLRRGIDSTSATMSQCTQRGYSTLVCRGSN